MSVKYFCDICEREVQSEQKITILGFAVKHQTICSDCWGKVEDDLLLVKNLDSK